tara:strand:+ start:3766 stop:5403 length:1638 start_codon:yes stop_codon:yes gene_type:complete
MAQSQPYIVNCRGGLNTNFTELEMLKQPGFATKLINFEVDPDGGYRRIKGFTAYGDTRPFGATDTKVLGVQAYADGIIVTGSDGIKFSNDGTTWIDINKTGVATAGDNYATFTGRSNLTRANQKQTDFTFFESKTTYGKLVICDGANAPYLFYMTGSGALNTRTFFAEELELTSHVGGVSNATDDPTTACYHKTILLASGVSAAPNAIAYSTFSATDPDETTHSNSNVVSVDDAVVALKAFRDSVIVFCKNSISKIVNVEDPAQIAVVPITKNVGCLHAHSIQEVGGDLIFLAPDGIRTLAATERIGDVELSTESRNIQELISRITRSINTYNISSTVLREKSQYRLFYSADSTGTEDAEGIMGTLTANGYEWSELVGIQAFGVDSSFDTNRIQQVYHGDRNGYIYRHDQGLSFLDGTVAKNIFALYTTPSLDCGDLGTKKTFHYVKVSISPEGSVNPTLRIAFDYEDPDLPQPPDYVLPTIPIPTKFGRINFGTGIFGGTDDPSVRQAVQGSGDVVNLTITSNDQTPAYAVNGFYINYVPEGRR